MEYNFIKLIVIGQTPAEDLDFTMNKLFSVLLVDFAKLSVVAIDDKISFALELGSFYVGEKAVEPELVAALLGVD